jgi:prophage regulatory protein
MELLSKKEVGDMLKMCERTIENLVRANVFPPPLRLGKTARWSKAVVEAWLAEQLRAQLEWKAPTRARRPKSSVVKAVSAKVAQAGELSDSAPA